MRSFRIPAIDIQAINSSMDAISDALGTLSKTTGSTSTSASSTQLASLQAQLDSLRAQLGAITGDVAAHAAHHTAAGSDPVQIDEAQVTNLVSDLGGKEPANANIQAHIASTSNPHSTTAAQVGAAPASHTHAEADVTNLTADLAAKEVAANKGAANGYAPLDASAKVPVSNLPTGLAPGAHASTHASGGSDPVAGMSGIFDDVVAAAGVTVTVGVGQQMIRFRRAIVRGRLVNHGRVVVR